MNVDGRFALILRFLICFKANSPDIPSFSAFFCEWDSTNKAKHWIKHDMPVRILCKPRHKNISNYALVDFSKLILLPLRIKQDLMKT